MVLLNEFYEAFCPYSKKELTLAMQLIEFSLEGVSLKDTPKMLYAWIEQSVKNGDYENYFSVNILQVVKDKVEGQGYIKGIVKLRSKLKTLYGYDVLFDEDVVISDEGVEEPFYVKLQFCKRLSNKDFTKATEALKFEEMMFLHSNMLVI